MLEDIEVSVIRHNVLCVGNYSTVDELIIIRVSINQSKVEIGILIDGGVEPCDGLDYIAGYFTSCLLREHFFIFVEYLCVHAKTDATS